ncbi:MAG: signal peptidase II [Verrucomicrobia bacterium]|nr:signal peptidase II [Verrucomicrobiota bacterium]
MSLAQEYLKPDFRADRASTQRMFLLMGVVLILDQFTKIIISHTIPFNSSHEVISGFFSIVHWGNTGAAWSLFHGKNFVLGCIGVLSLFALYYFRYYFSFSNKIGQIAIGMVMGGILGNLMDRFFRGHVVDFLYFFVISKNGKEIGYPAFNLADVGICVGIGVIILLEIFRKKQPHS